MYIEKHQNAAGSKIAVTATATGIFDLINTAATTTLVNAGFTSKVNAINITVEDGDIRVFFDGNTPTSVNGTLLSGGNVYYYRGVPLDKLKLIRVGGSNVACSVEIGHSEISESTNASAYKVELEVSPTIDIGNIQTLSADTSVAGTVSATNAAGGTTIVAANSVRAFVQCQNNGGVDVYFGAGTVTSSFPKVVPNGLFTWNSKEALKVLSSGAACNIAYIDYSNS